MEAEKELAGKVALVTGAGRGIAGALLSFPGATCLCG